MTTHHQQAATGMNLSAGQLYAIANLISGLNAAEQDVLDNAELSEYAVEFTGELYVKTADGTVIGCISDATSDWTFFPAEVES